ncbi:MAG: hypothetical protein ILP01_02300 [Clostridia bacterium]|nr:hypothetical protein [Clostridia bacterium]
MKQRLLGIAALILALVILMLPAFTACDINITVNDGNDTSGETGSGPNVSETMPDESTQPETQTPESTASMTESSNDTSEAVTTGRPEATTLPEATTQPEVTTQPEATTQPETLPAARPSDADMAAEAQKFINTDGVNGLLFSEFTDVKDANLWQVVAQLSDPSAPSGAELQDLYAKNGKQYSEYTGSRAVRASFLDSNLRTWTGFVSAGFKKYDELGPIYLATADVYSVQFGGVEFNPAKVVRTETDSRNGYIYVYYTADGTMSDNWIIKYNSDLHSASLMLLCVDWIDGHFVIVSNQAVWSSELSGGQVSVINERVKAGFNAAGFNGLLGSSFQEGYFFNRDLGKACTGDIWNVVATYQGEDLDLDFEKVYAENGVVYSDDIGCVAVDAKVLEDDLLRYTGYTVDDFMKNSQAGRLPDYLKTVNAYSVQSGGVVRVYFSSFKAEWVDDVYHVVFTDEWDPGTKHEAYCKLNWDGSYRLMANLVTVPRG